MFSFSDVSIVILAGGLGIRLRSVVKDQPKVLAPIQNRPFLSYLLDQIIRIEGKDVILCTGYRGDLVFRAFGDHYHSLKLSYSQEPEPLGTGGALFAALPFLTSEHVLVMNGDSYFDTDFNTFLNWHISNSSQATILLTEVCDVQRYGQVVLGQKHKVLNFIEKGGNTSVGLINSGIYLIRRELLRDSATRSCKNVSLEKDVFPKWIGLGLYGFKSQGRFIDIGTLESYKAAEGFFAEKLL
jgi:NDP-sugar pyrophosphorylase family protein